MAGAPIARTAKSSGSTRPAPEANPVLRRVLIGLAVAFMTIFIIVPLANVFTQALSKGVDAYLAVFSPPVPAQEATLSIAAVVLPLNILFGVAAAWATTKFRFPGRALLLALIDLPFSVSPVVAGLVFVLLLGRNGIFGDWATHIVWPNPASLHWVGFGDGYWPFAFGQFFSGVIFTPL